MKNICIFIFLLLSNISFLNSAVAQDTKSIGEGYICQNKKLFKGKKGVTKKQVKDAIDLKIKTLNKTKASLKGKPSKAAALAKVIAKIADLVNVKKLSNDCLAGKLAVTCTPKANFAYTGSFQSWTVPSGVTIASFQVVGASGGGGGAGRGGFAKGDISVTPGEVLTMVVGGRGSANGLAGFNGGGSGGGADAGGGGGASDVRRGGLKLLVAGGGGGQGGTGGATATSNQGGDGGGETGYSGFGIIAYYAVAGGGGYQSAGGSPGAGQATNGNQGSLGQGADGVNPPSGSSNGAGSGGGGGGYYGGGSGGVSLPRTEQDAQFGYTYGGPGGGGSGFGGTSYGVNTTGGDGSITVTVVCPK